MVKIAAFALAEHRGEVPLDLACDHSLLVLL